MRKREETREGFLGICVNVRKPGRGVLGMGDRTVRHGTVHGAGSREAEVSMAQTGHGTAPWVGCGTQAPYHALALSVTPVLVWRLLSTNWALCVVIMKA